MMVSCFVDNDQEYSLTMIPIQGPAHGRPMPLLLPGGSEVKSGEIASPSGDRANQQHKPDGAVKGKQVALEHSELVDYQSYLCMLLPINLQKNFSVVFLSWPW
jgi:hypothetical protein